ncbi:4-(cytidine 5'-diphospho)-2-C-methyl-D-erythritol kinase [Psychromonas ossibalaenae]|uniref:4-(cytidine 5'-diphospho)-2-C-methyl-D-erythritol kinase n=1 Tax=Psychromonas ossibalaenae TaxID=444922 RepID=UPI00037FA29A|nr:4-(cytidine 5'-diphospho)-2-C-methyl-D-erythritol kinase [Psychromonas ossibalaenae]
MINTDTIRWPAPAKLNLFLYINGQREDGYHELQTLFQFIDKCDYLTIRSNQSGEITITPEIEGLDIKDNLIYKAAMLLKAHAPENYGASIHLQKNLPMGGGLGGGSSDAATTLVALNYHWNINLSEQELADIGLELGADVPIFVHGKAAVAEGVGEQLSPANPIENSYLVAVPDCFISTPAVFGDPQLIRTTVKREHAALMNQKWSNDCQPCVKNTYPEVAKIIDWLIEYAPTRLTGTGACVFSTFNSLPDAQVLLEKTPAWLNAFTAQGLNNSPLRQLLSTLK